MTMLGKTEEQITAEMEHSFRLNFIQTIGILTLIAAGLAKGWTVHIENEIEEAKSGFIVATHLLESCEKKAATLGLLGNCNDRNADMVRMRDAILVVSKKFPNRELLALFGSNPHDTGPAEPR